MNCTFKWWPVINANGEARVRAALVVREGVPHTIAPASARGFCAGWRRWTVKVLSRALCAHDPWTVARNSPTRRAA